MKGWGTHLFLALDQGGHSSRALVLDASGSVLAQAQVAVSERHPEPDRVEQDPEELVESLRQAVDRVAGALGDACHNLRSAGLATQRSNVVCWRRDTGEALTPVLSWQDRRGRRWLGRFNDRAAGVHRVTGLYLSPHYGASKLRWCWHNVPAVRAAFDAGQLAWGPLASFLAFRLLDERPHLVDPANAARTLLWNLASRDWDAGLLALFGIEPGPLPRCVPSLYPYGHLSVGGQAVPMRLVTGDQAAALFAHGAPVSDIGYLNIGTGAFLQRVTGAAPRFVDGLLTGIVLDDGRTATYALEGTINGAGTALDWVAEHLQIADPESQVPVWLDAKRQPPLFLNGVAGLGSPWWIADFPSRFIGDGDRAASAVAVVESIVFLVCANLGLMGEAGKPLQAVCVTGGLSVLDGLCQRLANLSGLPVLRPPDHEATACGIAALLAGLPSDWNRLRSGDRFRPDPDDRGLVRRYQAWREEMEIEVADRRRGQP